MFNRQSNRKLRYYLQIGRTYISYKNPSLINGLGLHPTQLGPFMINTNRNFEIYLRFFKIIEANYIINKARYPKEAGVFDIKRFMTYFFHENIRQPIKKYIYI